MKSKAFVVFSSILLLAWLGASYVTDLQPQPRLGRGSTPLSAHQHDEKPVVAEEK